MTSKKYDELMKCDKKNTHYYTLDGDVYVCKCVSVYDGDSITVVFTPNGLDKFYKYTIRLDGIDTPEMRTTDPNERAQAIIVRDFVRETLLNKLITIKCGKFDKYGRLLAVVYIDGFDKSINDLLIEKKYAYCYDGGTKTKYRNLNK
jgi:micrococcal nuclease